MTDGASHWIDFQFSEINYYEHFKLILYKFVRAHPLLHNFKLMFYKHTINDNIFSNEFFSGITENKHRKRGS